MFNSIKPSIRTFFLSVSLLAAIVTMGQTVKMFPANSGDVCRYAAYVEIKKAYVSGVCVMANNDGIVSGGMFNEFGISLFDFTYDVGRDKVKITNCAAMIDRWYVKRVLRKDLHCLMGELKAGKNSYADTKHGITLTMTPITSDNIPNNETAE